MAVQFERNINLEEVDSDALFGIEYLSHQTTMQKIVLWGNVILGTASLIITELFYKNIPFLIQLLILLVFLGIGFLFGANQNEYLTIGGYLKLIFFKPTKYVDFKSTEDICLMKDEAKKVKAEAELQEKREAEATPEGQRRSLYVVLGLLIGFVVFLTVMYFLNSYKENQVTLHHTVGLLVQRVEIFRR